MSAIVRRLRIENSGAGADRQAALMLRPDTMALTALLALLTAFGPLATDMYVPSMPDVGRLLVASTSEVQLTLSSYLAGFAIGQVIYGPIADRPFICA
jgi:DHA1 family bicyclomycin/chloramphenicol resistance-like MFS transporter